MCIPKQCQSAADPRAGFQLPQIILTAHPSSLARVRDFREFQDACLLVIGGRAPEASWLCQAASCHDVWAVDHGLDACLAAGILPKRLIGDGDSAAPASWQFAETQGIPIEKFPSEKDDTDTQLALRIAKEAGFPAAIVTGAFGGRFDHALSTVTSCAFAPLPCLLADEREALFFVHSGEAVTFTPVQKPKAISLLPFTPRCCGVDLTGTHWPLHGATLEASSMRAVSNVLAAGSRALTVSLQGGLLGVYFVWHE